MESTFKGATKYGDWSGTAGADDHDHQKIRDYLSKNGVLKDDEFLIGIETDQGEEHETKLSKPLWVHCYFVQKISDYDTVAAQVAAQDPIQVRKQTIQIPVEDFFGFFKRFEIAISVRGLIDGRRLEYPG